MYHVQVIILSAPALSWDASINMTKVESEFFSDADIYMLGMGGEVSCVFNRYNKANNKYLKSYNPEQESKHIIYLDADNLYG